MSRCLVARVLIGDTSPDLLTCGVEGLSMRMHACVSHCGGDGTVHG